MMGRCHKHVFNKIVIPGCTPHGPLATPVLDPVFVCGGSLDIAQMGNGDHYIFLFDHVLHAEITGRINDFGTAGIPKSLLNSGQFILDQGHSQSFIF